VREALNRLLPDSRDYDNLKKALACYQSLSSTIDPPKITGAKQLAKGDSGPRVIALRKRTAIWYPGLDLNNEVFDGTLEQAIMEIQKQHGIQPTGIVGKETMAALNMTITQRVRQIEVNLERYRWLSKNIVARNVAVNIPAFELRLMESGKIVECMRVVVGKSDHRTPMLNSAMTYIVLSPYWHVPQAIAAKEILPRLGKEPTYLEKEKIRVFEKEDDELVEMDPDSIDWASVNIDNLRFRMDPGTRNSLGRVKFMFPNVSNVYLHDTPSKRLFNKSQRQFSHGCVRIEKPIELAATILGKDTSWVKDEIHKASCKDEEKVLLLPKPLPVQLQYFTAWVEEDGTLQFRNDIYSWDEQISLALQGTPTINRKPGVEGFASGFTKRNVGAAVQ
jgi:murein L,D-transpeptidase YcbB/YkuD